MQMSRNMLTLKGHPMFMDKINRIISPRRQCHRICETNNERKQINLSSPWHNVKINKSLLRAYQAFVQVVQYQSQLSYHWSILQGDKTTLEPSVCVTNSGNQSKALKVHVLWMENLLQILRETYQFLHITYVFEHSIPSRTNIRKHPVCMIKLPTLQMNRQCGKRLQPYKII